MGETPCREGKAYTLGYALFSCVWGRVASREGAKGGSGKKRAAWSVPLRRPFLSFQEALEPQKPCGNSPRLPDANTAQTVPYLGPRTHFC